MELLIKGTAKEIAGLVLALQGRRKQDLFVSNIGDFKVAASAIHGKPPAVPQRSASRDSEAGAAPHQKDSRDPQP